MSKNSARVRRKAYAPRDRTFYVYQASNQGSSCFFDADCFGYYLTRLHCCIKAYRFQLHTYALLPGELHLLVSAFSTAGLVRLVTTVNASYQHYFNNRFERHCQPLTGRPVCRRLAGGELVLDCQKYIELTPVQKGLTDLPGEYPWTGYPVNGFGGHGRSLVAHHQYRELCAGRENPFQYYREFIAKPFSAAQKQFLERRLRYGYPLVGFRSGNCAGSGASVRQAT